MIFSAYWKPFGFVRITSRDVFKIRLMKRTLQIANGVALVFTIIFNYLSNTGIFDGKTIGDVSDQYNTSITPAGYAFSIWGLIYVLLFAFVIYTGRSLFKPDKNDADGIIEQVGWWFVVSCITNCAWIVVWLNGWSGLSVVILVIAMISLTKILLETLNFAETPAKKWFVNVPFQIYAGWMSVALIVATAAWLGKIGWDGLGISGELWTVILIAVATVIHLMMTWRKNSPLFAIVGIWAFVAIAQANSESSSTIYICAMICAAVLFGSSLFNMIRRKSV